MATIYRLKESRDVIFFGFQEDIVSNKKILLCIAGHSDESYSDMITKFSCDPNYRSLMIVYNILFVKFTDVGRHKFELVHKIPQNSEERINKEVELFKSVASDISLQIQSFLYPIIETKPIINIFGKCGGAGIAIELTKEWPHAILYLATPTHPLGFDFLVDNCFDGKVYAFWNEINKKQEPHLTKEIGDDAGCWNYRSYLIPCENDTHEIHPCIPAMILMSNHI